jgi:hypothetical protein
MMYRIPFRPILGAQAVRVRLGEATFVLRVRWIERTQRHVLDVLDASQVPVVLGRHLEINGRPLLGLVSTSAPRGGILIVLAASSPDVAPGPAEFGARVNLYWADTADLATSLKRAAATIESEA